MTAISVRLAFVALLATAAPAWPGPAHGQAAAPVRAEQPWARATAPQQQVGGAYVTLTSPVDDRLLAASSPAAAKVKLHEMRMNGTIMQMRELTGGLPLPAGQATALAPGGYHLMLVGLVHPLRAGDVVPVQLRFQHAPPLDLQFVVGAAGARGPAGGGAGGSGDTPGGMPGMSMPGGAAPKP